MKLPYISYNITETKSPYGVPRSDIELGYKDTYPRNFDIYRLDAMSCIKDRIVGSTYYSDLREYVFNVISGYADDANTISHILTTLFDMDSYFKDYLKDIMLFREDAQGKSTLVYIVLDIRNVISSYIDEISKKITSKGYKLVGTSDYYVYFAVPNNSTTLFIPTNCDYKVVSNAKDRELIYI